MELYRDINFAIKLIVLTCTIDLPSSYILYTVTKQSDVK